MWRVIPGYEHYDVSSGGGSDHWPASSITRNGRTRHYDGQILTPIPNPKTGHLGRSTCTATAREPRPSAAPRCRSDYSVRESANR